MSDVNSTLGEIARWIEARTGEQIRFDIEPKDYPENLLDISDCIFDRTHELRNNAKKILEVLNSGKIQVLQ